MNINDKTQIRECTSCQMCGAVCPVNAISIDENKNGFYRPYIDSNKCIDCSLCVKGCYKFDNNILLTQNFEKKTLFSAWTNDSQVLKETTSGGIADTLVTQLLKEGYKCIGIIYDDNLNRAVGKIASTRDQSIGFRGSKYIQAYTLDSFKELVKTHKTDKYAIFGLPCQIYAINKFLSFRKDRDRHILIDLYCHGCPSIHLWDKSREYILKKANAQNVYLPIFRSKAKGWGKFIVEATIEKGRRRRKYVSSTDNSPFYTLFFSDTVLNDSCNDCMLRNTLEYTDIRLGDFWGYKFLKNQKGVSAVTCCTKRGDQLMESIRTQIECQPQIFESFIPYQSYGKTYKVNQDIRHKLLAQLADPDINIETSIRTYKKSLGMKRCLVDNIKSIIKLLPDPLVASCKNLYYSVKYRR